MGKIGLRRLLAENGILLGELTRGPNCPQRIQKWSPARGAKISHFVIDKISHLVRLVWLA